jgi:glycosyltransferase involved in cell wall biosynthesis
MNNNPIIPITHIITDLDTGGAEIMLSKLLKTVDCQRFPSRVISLTTTGSIGQQIEALGISVSAMGMKPGQISLSDITHLTEEIIKQDPAIVQTWMYHADLLGGLAAKRAGIRQIAWNIRNSTLDWKKSKTSTMFIVAICALLSHSIPKKIVICSQAAAKVHRKAGYNEKKMRVIPNGFDLTIFKPDRNAGFRLRESLGLGEHVPVVGLAARFDKQKDHETFIRSAEIVLKSLPEAQFILCGDGITAKNPSITRWLSTFGVADHFHLLGRWTDMAQFHSACDVAVSSSAYGESFSNVLGEAMACGVPCISTRVGGAEELMGNIGRIVPPGDPIRLGEAVSEILLMPEDQHQDMSRMCRERVQQNFDINHIARTYMRFWEELIAIN